MTGRILELFHDGGYPMIAIAIVSVVSWVIIALKWLELNERPTRRQILRASRRGALDTLATDAPHTEPIAVAIQLRERGESRLRGVVEPLGFAARARLLHGLGPLAALAALLPLLGLLGTVLGMLATFEAIKLHGTGDPRLLAHGIRQALLTTQAGLCAAVPVLVLMRYLRSKANRLADAIDAGVHSLEVSTNGGQP